MLHSISLLVTSMNYFQKIIYVGRGSYVDFGVFFLLLFFFLIYDLFDVVRKPEGDARSYKGRVLASQNDGC